MSSDTTPATTAPGIRVTHTGAGGTGEANPAARVKVPRDRAWGSDDARRKGGDFFGVAAARQVVACATERISEGTPAAARG